MSRVIASALLLLAPASSATVASEGESGGFINDGHRDVEPTARTADGC
jgi:hypothetical protein